MSEEKVRELADMVGGRIEEMHRLPDGSGFAVMSMPLPATHWIHGDGVFEAPPMPFKMGRDERIMIAIGKQEGSDCGLIGVTMTRQAFEEKIREAARYAVRATTMNGKEPDFDPDAMVGNLVVGMLGYYTTDGLTGTDDDWANPPRFRKGAQP